MRVFEDVQPVWNQSEIDAKHVRNLAICHGVCAALLLLAGLGCAAYPAFLDWVMAQGPNARQQMPDDQIAMAKNVMIGYAVVFLTITLLDLVACICLAARKARVFCIVIAAIELLAIPLGTILGVFTIITLVKPSVIELFEQNKS